MSQQSESSTDLEPPRQQTGVNWIVVTGITLLFLVLYLILRNLPDTQCAVLHYEVTRETADGIEMCADGPSGLMDLQRLKFPGRYVSYSPRQAAIGKPYRGEFAITGPKGDELLPHEIAITHAEKIHLIAVDSSLNDYHHLHPVPIANSGRWTYTFTPQAAGTYDLYVECVPLKTRKQLIINTQLEIETNDSKPLPASASQRQQQETSEGLHLDWTFSQDPVRAGSWVEFTITLSDAEGLVLTLEKFMDAYSHVVAFREGTTGYAHLHPIESKAPIDPEHPVFAFTFYSGEPGNYRLWAQFQRNGNSIFLPHDVEVY